jgi:hypothetical protein
VAGTTTSGRRFALARTPAEWTIAVFGALAAALGAIGLIWPDLLLRALGFTVVDPGLRAPGDHTRVFLAASSMASLNMGVYYLVAAATRWRPFFRFTVVFRLLTCAVFTGLVVADVAPGRFLGVALWEGAGAAATGLALAYEARSPGRRAVDTDHRRPGVGSKP